MIWGIFLKGGINMAIKTTCKRCGKMFVSNDLTKICMDCKEVDRKSFYIVKEYLYGHSGATIGEVNRDTGVSVADIERMIEDGKISRMKKE
jgi:hypothetical protein